MDVYPKRNKRSLSHHIMTIFKIIKASYLRSKKKIPSSFKCLEILKQQMLSNKIEGGINIEN